LLPILNGSRVELPDHPRLVAQLCQLERRTARGGRDSIDHAPGAHDDLANAVAGTVVTALQAAFEDIPFVKPIIISASDYAPSRPYYESFINSDGTIRSTPRGRFP
jgi:hypothetical protein